MVCEFLINGAVPVADFFKDWRSHELPKPFIETRDSTYYFGLITKNPDIWRPVVGQ